VTNSILAHPFVPGKEIAEALIIVFACMMSIITKTNMVIITIGIIDNRS
jgi:hypothetical protein